MTNPTRTAIRIQSITDHEAIARRIRRERARMTGAMLRRVQAALAGMIRAAVFRLSAGSAASR